MTTANPDDMAFIQGAEAIAAVMHITRAQFYKAHYLGALKCVWREPGIGLVTTRRAIRLYQDARAGGKSPAEAAEAAGLSAHLDNVT